MTTEENQLPISDEELQQRHRAIVEELEEQTKKRNRMKIGGKRDQQSRWCGCLMFNKLTVESELRERGLLP